MSNKTKGLAVGVVIAFAMLIALTWGMSGSDVQAAPVAAPTPVTIYAGGVLVAPATFYDAAAIIADGNSAELQVGSHEKIDLQIVADLTPGSVNTTTFKLQFSNDGTNWVDGATVGSALAADANTLQQYAVFGRYVRVNADVTNVFPVTTTIIGVLR